MSFVFGSLRVEDNFTGARSYVRAATTAAGTLASSFFAGQTVDGVTLALGDRLLIKNQASGAENGIYIVESAGAPTRANDAAANDFISGVHTWVREGTANANTAWICTNAPGSDEVSVDALTFAQYDVVADLAVARGGTGVSSLTSGQVLVGAGTSAVDLTKAAPTGDFVGTSDAQTLSNKTLSAPTVSGDIVFDEATNDLTLAVADQGTGTATATIPDMGGVSQDLVLTAQSQTLTNKTMTAPVLNSVPTFSLDDGSFDLTIASVSSLTAGRTLTLDVNDAARTLSMGGDISTGGALTTAGAFTTSGAFPITLTATASTSVTLPTSGILANQAYVDSVAQGLDVKESVVVATTVALSTLGTGYLYTSTDGASGRGQITWTTGPTAIDGVTLANNDRILVKNNGDASNGIWVRTSANTWDRATDFDADSEVTSGAFTFVEEGTINVSTGWVLTTPDPITIGGVSGTTLTFSMFSASGDVIAGPGLSKNGNELQVNTSTTIAIVSDNVVVNSTNTANQILLSSGTAGTEASFGALPLGDANAVTGQLGLANGGTSANLSGATGSRLIQTNAGTTALETTTAPQVTALTSTTGSENFVTFTDPGTIANYLNVAAAAAGTDPTLSVVGTDTDISLAFQGKGTGTFDFLSTASAPAEIRLYEDTGTNYVGLDVPNVTASYTLTLPPAVGTSQQVLRLADGSGNLEFATISAATGLVGYSIWSGQISVVNNTDTAVAYFAWDESQYGTYADPSTVIFWYEDVTNRDLIVTVYNVTAAATLGTTTISNPAANGIGTISIATNPSADARVEFRVRKSGGGGTNPQIFGIQWEFTH